MPSYQFTKTVNKAEAFNIYLQENFPVNLVVNIEGTNVTCVSVDALTSEQETLLTTLITDYVDPEVFLQFSHTESLSGVSEKSNQQTPRDVQAYIFPSTTNITDGTVLDALKTIVKVQCYNVETLLNTPALTTGSVTINVHDDTRNMDIGSETVNFDDVVSGWHTAATNGLTGEVVANKTVMFTGLINSSTNYDCIWSFRISTTDSRFYGRLNGLQQLFYNPL
jgi:hypothetical protein